MTEILQERLNLLADSYKDIKKMLGGVSEQLNDIVQKVALVERVSKEVDVVKENVDYLKTKVTTLDAQLTTPVENLTKNYSELRDKVVILEEKVYNKNATFSLIYNTILHIVAIVSAAILLYQLGIKQ